MELGQLCYLMASKSQGGRNRNGMEGTHCTDILKRSLKFDVTLPTLSTSKMI